MPDAEEKSGEKRSDRATMSLGTDRTLARSREQRERRARAGAYVTGSVISFHAKRTWIIQPWMCAGIIFHRRKQTVTAPICVLPRQALGTSRTRSS